METGTLSDTAVSVAAQMSRLQPALDSGHFHELVDGLGAAAGTLRASAGSRWPEYVEALRCTAAFAAAQQDPLTRHAFDKPRGYPGDALLLDYIYRDWSLLEPPRPASLGAQLYGWTNGGGAPTAVRWRRQHLAQLIDEAAARTLQPRSLAVACGHLREAALSGALARHEVGELVALDQDAQSLAEVRRQADLHHWPVTAVHSPIRRLIAGRTDLGNFSLVYAAGLYDYLETPVALRLTQVLFDMLEPGGRLVIANFTPATRDRAYMEAFMDWWLIYRTSEEVDALAAQIDPAQVATRHSYLCPTGNVAYLALRRTEEPSSLRSRESRALVAPGSPPTRG